jgi:hypothetical protein
MQILIKKKEGYRLLGLFTLIILAALVMPMLKNAETPSSSTTLNSVTTTTAPVMEPSKEVRVEVYHFHTTNQCYSCIRLGELAKKTLDTHFMPELESGLISFDHINVQLPENRDIVQKYGARGSALFIGTYIDGEFHPEENIMVWYRLNNEGDYMEYFKGLLDKRLKGDLT